MGILSVFLAAVSCILVFFDLVSQKLQYLSLAVAAAFFLIAWINRKKNAEGALSLRKEWFVPLFILLALCNFVARTAEHVFDFSQDHLYQLQPNTIAWLEKLQQPVTIMVFVQNDSKTVGYAEFLKEKFAKETALVDVQIKNINRDVELANKYKITTSGQTVLLSQDHWVLSPDFYEKSLLSGLVRLLAKGDSTLCFLVGHGEADLDDHDISGLGKLKSELQNAGFPVKAVSLFGGSSEALREKCGVLFMVSPKTALLDAERELLDQSIKDGLKFFYAFDYPLPESIAAHAQNIGLDVNGKAVVNPQNATYRIPIHQVIFENFGDHPVVQGLQGKLLLPEVRDLHVLAQNFLQWTPLLQTFESEPFRQIDRPQLPGEFQLALTASSSDGKAQGVAFGTGQMWTNQYLDFSVNRELLLNTIRWLAGTPDVSLLEQGKKDEVLLRVRPENLFQVKLFFIVVLPFAALLTCGILWLVRRR